MSFSDVILVAVILLMILRCDSKADNMVFDRNSTSAMRGRLSEN